MKLQTSFIAFFLICALFLGACTGCTRIPSSDTDSTAEQPTDMESADALSATISIEDSYAAVETSCGLIYTAQGYDSAKDHAFAFAKGLLLSFDDAFAGDFNRFTIKYSASAPMKITISYTENAEPCTDVFYLEAGEKEFSAVNRKFLQKGSGCALTEIRVDTCEGKSADFILYDLKTEIVSVPKSQQYLTGSRYTLGVELKWGGAIHSLEDKECAIDGVTNLVNMHDEGRLIQQSYYGVFYRESEYVEGGYLGVEGVAYNPVQGGDVSKRDSRLIDYKIEDNSIYVKAQPLDWPLKDSLTPSYMENKYVMEDDYVYVYNRFVDFSGWDHPALDQEIPAVYTVNVLDTFVWYNGNKPWSGDSLTTIDDWSEVDPNTNKSSHYRQYTIGNTETWCALINADTQYGVGIYVPNVDRVLTMRYLSGQKGSNQCKGNPCSYMCPINVIEMKSFEPIEYSYLLTAGDLDEIRETFTQNRDFDANEGLNIKNPTRAPYEEETDDAVVDFSIRDSLSSIFYPRSTEYVFDETEKAVVFKAVDADPNVTLVFDYAGKQLFAEDYGVIEIEYMIPTTNAQGSYETQLFLCSGDVEAPTAEAVVTDTLIADSQYHTLQISVRELDFWSGLIHMVRFDYFSSPTPDDVIFVKAFRFVAN